MKKMLLVTVFCLMSALPCLAADTPFIVPVDQDGIQRVEIVAGEYFFKPGHIVVKVNMPVELKVRKESLLIPHDIVIKAPDAGITISESLSRKPMTFFFTPGKTGSYPIYCSKKPPFMKSHRDKGMEGVLEVVE